MHGVRGQGHGSTDDPSAQAGAGSVAAFHGRAAMTLTAAQRTARYSARFKAAHGISYKVARRRAKRGSRFCRRCGKSIDDRHLNATFCGRKCLKAWHWNPNAPVIVKCGFCFKDYDRTHGKQRYCSLQCRQDLKRESDWERRNGVAA